jgi:hypothetical protein
MYLVMISNALNFLAKGYCYFFTAEFFMNYLLYTDTLDRKLDTLDL